MSNLSNIMSTNNSTSFQGGAISGGGSIVDSEFIGNSSSEYGGALSGGFTVRRSVFRDKGGGNRVFRVTTGHTNRPREHPPC